MIIATGIDIVDIQRIEQAVEKHGKTFLDRVYTQAEQNAAPKTGPTRWTFLAGRWAVKEAVSKALGTGIGADCAMTDVQTLNNDAGKPVLALEGTAAKTAKTLGIARIHISISHERGYAVASAIAESDN